MPGQKRYLFVAALVGAICLSNPLLAAVTPPDKPSDPTSVPTTDPKPTTPDVTATKVEIKPHRAIYKMSLANIKNGSNVSDVNGKMLFEWADNCDGWAVQQHMQLHFSYAEGDETNINSTSLSWESKDGAQYNFNVKRLTNGEETEAYRGRANLQDKAGRGVYSVPKDKQVTLDANTVFPSFHTRLILENAVTGNHLFSRRVFDGSDEAGLSDISAFIGKKMEANAGTEMNPALKDNPLLAVPSWPVRLAFFKPDSETGESDYEMDLTLLANGVARNMLIDYGDFSLSGVLSSLEALPPSSCPTPED